MKILNINNLAARKVLAAVKPLLRATKRGLNRNKYAYIQPYTNCREYGFAISTNTHMVAFAEHRTNDDIVVYFGEPREFNFNTNIPSDRVYAKAHFYSRDHVAQAAKFIVRYLTVRRG